MPFVTGRKENIIDFYLYFLSFLEFLPCPRSETHQPDCCREPFVLGRDALQRVLGRWAGFGGKIPTNWLMGCISDGVGGSLLVFALSRCRACPGCSALPAQDILWCCGREAGALWIIPRLGVCSLGVSASDAFCLWLPQQLAAALSCSAFPPGLSIIPSPLWSLGKDLPCV